jgi:adenine phosphoribosyltransferase
VVLVDDLIATGGTALAGFDLVDQLGATVHEFAAMITLPFLDGVGKIHAYKVRDWSMTRGLTQGVDVVTSV